MRLLHTLTRIFVDIFSKCNFIHTQFAGLQVSGGLHDTVNIFNTFICALFDYVFLFFSPAGDDKRYKFQVAAATAWRGVIAVA